MKRFFVLAAVFLLFGACSTEQEPEPEPTDAQVSVDASIEDANPPAGGGSYNPFEPPSGGGSSGGGGTPGPPDVERDAGSQPPRCECFMYPVQDPPYTCLVEFCTFACEHPGPTGQQVCFYTGGDPPPPGM
jgi:hypothetical protein